MEFIENKAYGEVKPQSGKNPRVPYEHQKSAMEALSKIDRERDSYSGLIVLPTGGGKTYTAATWLLKNAIDKNKKVLWIAHRQFLLDQAADAFQRYAYEEQMPHISSFTFRIISGSTHHDRMIDISPDDDVIIASKDSVGRSLETLDIWLEGQEEIYLVIDEAHHATAKTYRHIIDYLKQKVSNVKTIGLTATPFRTDESEQGLLKKVFPDDIIYSVSLKELINRQILSRLDIEVCQTGEEFGKDIGKNDWESIVHMDTIPDSIAKKIADSKERNHLIVETYKNNQKKYGQTIVFTVSIDHAIALSALFNKAGVNADYIVSSVRDIGAGATISAKENERKLESYRNGDLQVLVNVEILTEGIDLPQTKTVFLARPTVSKTLLTQMIGRALRGVRAGGTEVAYAVSFIDNWDIPFVYPDSLLEDENAEFDEKPEERIHQEVRLISISKIEEFARMLDDTVDTSAIEAMPFVERIPIGMYSFVYLDQDGTDISYQIMVYNSNQEAYRYFLDSLPDIYDEAGSDDEYISAQAENAIEQEVHDTFFDEVEFPEYDSSDIRHVIEYYAQKEAVPKFYSFEDIDKNRLDVAKIAQEIYDKDMGLKAQADYENRLWDEGDDNILRLFFGEKTYFIKNIENEVMKLTHPELFENNSHVKYGQKSYEDLPLGEIAKVNPKLEKRLRDDAFNRNRDSEGYYHCVICGKRGNTRRGFNVDHIIPLNKGGKSIAANLQILCSECNGRKGDH